MKEELAPLKLNKEEVKMEKIYIPELDLTQKDRDLMKKLHSHFSVPSEKYLTEENNREGNNFLRYAAMEIILGKHIEFSDLDKKMFNILLEVAKRNLKSINSLETLANLCLVGVKPNLSQEEKKQIEEIFKIFLDKSRDESRWDQTIKYGSFQKILGINPVLSNNDKQEILNEFLKLEEEYKNKNFLDYGFILMHESFELTLLGISIPDEIRMKLKKWFEEEFRSFSKIRDEHFTQYQFYLTIIGASNISFFNEGGIIIDGEFFSPKIM